MMPTLLELSMDMQRLDHLLAANGGEVTAEVEQALATWASDLDGQFHRKVDGYAAFIRELDHRAEIREGEAERLAKKARADARIASYLRDRLKAVFQDRGIKKLETDRFTVSIANNGGKLPIEVDETDVPEKYLRFEPRMDREAIRAELQQGIVLPFARLGEAAQDSSSDESMHLLINAHLRTAQNVI